MEAAEHSTPVRDLHTLLEILEQAKREDGVIPTRKFLTYFKIGKAIDDGNCLFHSISQLLPEGQRRAHQEIRHVLCQFYKRFDADGNYPEDSFQFKLQLQMSADNEEENGLLHQNVICDDRKWAGMMDVIALTGILKINIVVFSMVPGAGGYTDAHYIYDDAAPVLYVKYNGRNHFEPLTFKGFSKSARPIARPITSFSSPPMKPGPAYDIQTPMKPRHIKKASALEDAPDVSPETQRLIDSFRRKSPTPPKQPNKASALEDAPDVSPETQRLIDSFRQKSPTPPKQPTKASALEDAPDVSPETQRLIDDNMSEWKSAVALSKKTKRKSPLTKKVKKTRISRSPQSFVSAPQTNSRSPSLSPGTRAFLQSAVEEDITAPVAARTRRGYKRLL